MSDKKSDFRNEKRIAKEMAQELLGQPVNPDWGNRLEYWELRKEAILPRSFMYVFDLKTDRCILSHGMSFIGYNDNALLTSSQLLDAVHEDHRELFEFQAYRVHQALFFLNYDQIGFDYYLRGVHAVNDTKGKPWLTTYTSEVFQYDENGIACRYLSWCNVLSPYRGEPLYINFFHRTNNPDKVIMARIQEQLDKIQEDQLGFIGFTEEQIETLKLLSLGNSVKEVAAILDLSVATINKRNLKALKVANLAFPSSKFHNHKDLVYYLVRQELI